LTAGSFVHPVCVGKQKTIRTWLSTGQAPSGAANITEANRTHLALFDKQNSTRGQEPNGAAAPAPPAAPASVPPVDCIAPVATGESSHRSRKCLLARPNSAGSLKPQRDSKVQRSMRGFLLRKASAAEQPLGTGGADAQRAACSDAGARMLHLHVELFCDPCGCVWPCLHGRQAGVFFGGGVSV
jgi:hypothetical protein